jgi:hypothetical protein
VFATELQDCLHWVAGIVDSSSYDGDESLKATSYQLYNETQKSEYLLNELKI